ncbi:hypothetical protein Ga0609869_003550 [Rhodovulum iodosum]|uniref:AsmA-like C-terminal domain-containing protein n=1 Tax=Rhodovulum iodosum TaxID=68291 RepID=A0ABV3Y0Q8_9RHOB|nr:AsmA-like C-terminal region-containing protein [Rhodovulum robiginosum]RSK38170.1 hypothetical protein EJA01_02495 [Rhodovulum robiginosum]
MTETDRPTDPQTDIDAQRRFGLWLLLSLAMLAGLAGLAGLALTGRTVSLPEFVTERIEARLNAGLAPAELRLGGVDVFVSRRLRPEVHLREVAVFDATGRPVARLPELSARIAPGPAMQGRLMLREVALTGAELTLRRAPDGRIDLALGQTGAAVTSGASLAAVLDQIDRAFQAPALAAVENLSVEALGLTYEDARSGRIWRIDDGLMTLEQDDAEVALRVFFSLEGGAERPAEFAVTFVSAKGSPAARMSTNFSAVPAGDIATQSPALAFLSVIDAPISGALRTEVDASGSLGQLSAALEIGAGALKPVEGAPPIGFTSGKSYFSYAPDEAKIVFDEIALDTELLRLRADGHAYLTDTGPGGWPETLVAQMGLREVVFSPEGVFDAPARFNGGALDLKLALDPFTATIGQAVLTDDAHSYRGAGTVAAAADGWRVSVDAELDEITDARLLSLWPVGLVPATRDWFSRNVDGGTLFDVHAAVRLAPGAPARLSLDHEFRDATVSVLRDFPPVLGGQGYGTLSQEGYTLVVEKGRVEAPQGGLVDVAGSVLRLSDLGQRPVRATITLALDSAIPAVLSLIDAPPLRLLRNADIGPGIAAGRAEIAAEVNLPIKHGLRPADVDFRFDGTLHGMRSEVLVPGRVLAADAIRVRGDRAGLSLSGAATLDGVPLSVAWQRSGDGPGRVEGTVELSQRTAETFGLGLPAGSLSGAAAGAFTLSLDPAAPRFTLESDLNRLAISVPGLGWSKRANATGRLSVEGRLGDAPAIERLAISAPGLDAEGRVTLRPGGALDSASLTRLRVGTWLEGGATITGRGAGRAPAIALTGGRVDLRDAPFGRGGGGPGGPIRLELDEVVVAEGLVLNAVTGELSPDGGLNGAIRARLNGTAPIEATLAPSAEGTAVEVRAADAGAALSALGAFGKARGGALDLTLTPTGRPGEYSGRLGIENVRVRGTSVLTELLSAMSVVGLIDILYGEGLMFSEVDARFRLTTQAVQITRGSAVGPSLGISMAGVYRMDTKRLDMQGVVSPIYMLNSIGSVLTRKGEGLFGVNYRLVGDANAPQVRVNPLSILTPGMFREIFRSAPPQGAGQ